jgi:hypothetical protein
VARCGGGVAGRGRGLAMMGPTRDFTVHKNGNAFRTEGPGPLTPDEGTHRRGIVRAGRESSERGLAFNFIRRVIQVPLK